MRKLAKNEIRLSSKSWHTRNTSSIYYSIQDRKRNPSSMNELADILETE
jgi:hypothetical protein